MAAVLMAALTLAACTHHKKHAPSTIGDTHRPNIVFLLTDDLSLDLLPFLPSVQRMEQQGVTFTNYFVTDSLCCPSRSSIFTGQFPHTDGVFRNGGPDGGFEAFTNKGDDKSTFATTLHDSGYRTGMMGKYLNGYMPVKKYIPPGWDEWDVAGDAYPEFNYNINVNGRVDHHGKQPADYMTDVLADRALAFVDDSVAQAKPFMLEVATFAPHGPFVPAPRDADKFPGLTVPRTGAYDKATANAVPWFNRPKPLNPGQTQILDSDFRKRAQAVQAVDLLLTRVEKELEAKGVADNTYIVFSSDNGYHLGQHRLLAGKQTAYDTDTHVPLVVTGPGVTAGRRVDAFTENIDLRPTFEAIAQAKTPDAVEGHDLLPVLKGESPTDWRTTVLFEHHGPIRSPADPDFDGPESVNPPSYEGIRTASWLYVEYEGGQHEFYDLVKDPEELDNLAGSMDSTLQGRLHDALSAAQSCEKGQGCWNAQHNPR
jgi:arylsulfatase A-like enzyme